MAITIRDKKDKIKKACERLSLETNFDLDIISTEDLNELWKRAVLLETYYYSFLRVSKGLTNVFKES